jgi:xylan 1,4-beta-xylosidase
MTAPHRPSLRLLPALLLSLLSSTLYPSSDSAAAPTPVVFDSFTYTGRDTVFETPLPAGHFRNPILAGYYPDPSICRVPGKNPGDPADYYLINSTFSHFPGIPIFHSRDLVNWKQLGHVIDRPDQLNYDGLGITRGLFAPAIEYHNGTFYVVCTLIGRGGNFLVTATDPAGPWSDPIWLNFDGIDPSLFFDDDGRAWMVNNGNPPDNKPLYDGHRAIWIQEFDVAAKKLIGPRSIIVNGGVDLSKKPVWIEGPHLYKRDGWYYLCCAEGGTSVHHSQVILRSKSPTGPFEPWDKNPILTQRDLDGNAPHAVTCTGHADLVIGPDGNWWSIFLACRPYAPDTWATGRETFLLPVKWTDDGWPQILPPGERVPYIVPSPNSANLVANPAQPLSGNFTWTDDFNQPALSPLWIMIRSEGGARTPSALSSSANWIPTWLTLDDATGQLALTPRTELLSGTGNPSFLGRRLQHSKFEISAKLQIPVTTGISAGLAVSQNETHHYFTGVRRSDDGLTTFVELQNGPAPETLVSLSLPADAASIELRLTGDGKVLSFDYALTPGNWKPLLPKADAYPISVQASGGGIHFTGALVGPYARLDSASPTTAHVPYPPKGKAEKAHQQLLAKARTGRTDLYFLGDSITRRWGATDYPDFLAHWKKTFHGWNAANFGWGGDSTHHILWRIQNGELDGVNPKVVVLLAGTNNLGKAPKPGAAQDAAEGIAAILDTIHAKAPASTVILLPILPRNDSPEAARAVTEANALIKKLADGKHVRLLDLTSQLSDANGQLHPDVHVDKLHLSLAGYEIWAKALTPILTELLGPRATQDYAPPPTGDIRE